MTYSEFCDQIAPSVLELEKECSKISLEEFKEFREDVMHEAGKHNYSKKFMSAVLDMIYGHLFFKDTAQGVA